MHNISRQNQNIEITQLAKTSHNIVNLTAPQIGSSNIHANPNNNPQFTQNFNSQFSPNFNPQFNQIFNWVININPNINVEVKNDQPKNFELIIKRPLSLPVKFGLESKKMNCSFCNKSIQTKTEISMNMKALLTAIGKFFLVLLLLKFVKIKILVSWIVNILVKNVEM